MNIAVIGAGAGGIGAAKEILAQQALQRGDGRYIQSVTVYEQSDRIGGVWVYSDRVGKDQFGIDIHTSMYKDLM